MRMHTFPLAAIAASLLAGCVNDPVTPVASTQPAVVAPAAGAVVTSPGAAVVTQPPVAVIQQPAPAVVVPTQPVIAYRAGLGRVNSINRMPDASRHEGSEAPVLRIGVTMDDGTVQWVDTRAQGLAIGDRVELTADSRIQYPAASR